MYLRIVIIVFLARYTFAKHNCEIREEKLDIIFNCCDKLINDGNYHDTLESIQQSTQDEKNIKVLRNVHVMMDNNNISYLKRLPLLSHVTKISFKHNRIGDTDTGLFRNLPQLRTVDFSFNQFTGDNLTAKMFQGNEVQDRYEPLLLEHLIMSNNRITYLHHDLFKHLPNLILLELNNNPIDHINRDTERALHSLKKLKVLNFAQIGISNVPDMLFEAIPIETLFLNENHFVEIPRSLSQSSTIKYLNLNDNPIREINSKSFTKLIRLQELHLCGMKNLSKINENTFLSLVNLETLQCSFNPNLHFIHPKAFSWKTNRKLKELYINNNALQDLSENLIDWKKLQVLNIRGNPWNCTCALQWLFNLVENRQHHDPESNLGVRCQYPESLYKRSLIMASGTLQCDESDNILSIRSSRSKDFILCMAVLAMVYIVLQLVYFKMIRNKSRPRHTGTSIKSTVKYKPAQSMIYL